MQNAMLVPEIINATGRPDSQAGPAPSPESFRLVGVMAGQSVYSKLMSGAGGVLELVREMSGFFKSMGGGVLRVEEADEQRRRFAFTVLHDASRQAGGDVDPAQGIFQEGLIAGVLSSHFGSPIEVRQVERWGRNRVLCRYEASPAAGIPLPGVNGGPARNGASS